MYKFLRSIIVSVILFVSVGFLSASTIKFEGGKLKLNRVKKSSYSGSGILAANTVYRAGNYSFELKKGEKVKFSPKYNYVKSAILAKSMSIKLGKYSYRIKAGKKIEFNRTYKGIIYPSAGYLASSMKIKVGRRSAMIKGRVAWYSSGRLMAAELKKDTKLKRGKFDLWYAKGSKIYLSSLSSSKLNNGDLRKAKTIKIGKNDIPVRGKSWGASSISFNYKGNVLSVMTAKETTVKVGRKKYKVKKNSLITFHSNSSIKHLRVAKKTKTRKGTALAGHKIQFLATGKVKKVSKY